MIINLHAVKSFKKEAKRKANRTKNEKIKENLFLKEDKMHDIDRPITLEDLTNPDKS